MQLNIFADKGYCYTVFKVSAAVNHAAPFTQIGLAALKREQSDNRIRKTRLLKREGDLIETGQVDIFDNTVIGHIAEQRYFCASGLINRMLSAQNNDIGADAYAQKLLDRVLCRLCFQLH